MLSGRLLATLASIWVGVLALVAVVVLNAEANSPTIREPIAMPRVDKALPPSVCPCPDAPRPILSEIARPRRRPARRPRHQQRQRKADPARDQHRSQRVFLHLLRNCLRTVTESIAAVLVSVFCVVNGGIRSFARRIFGLAVQVLRRSRRLADLARSLSPCITGNTADGAFDLTREILRGANNSILVHGALS